MVKYTRWIWLIKQEILLILSNDVSYGEFIPRVHRIWLFSHTPSSLVNSLKHYDWGYLDRKKQPNANHCPDEELPKQCKKLNFYPNGRQPNITPTPVNTPTMSLTEIAIIQPPTHLRPFRPHKYSKVGNPLTHQHQHYTHATSQLFQADATPNCRATATSKPTINLPNSLHHTGLVVTSKNIKTFKKYGIPTDVIENHTLICCVIKSKSNYSGPRSKQLQVHARKY
jgi:hypothetical protein